jgi:hypothetical protein
VVGSIQYTNDLDVHIALITAQSYAKERAEKYYTSSKTNHQIIREYIDLFGFMSKNPNAMDIMIEEARSILRTWGAAEPNFLLTNSKLTFQMTMIPEKTQYLTQGPDGQRKLREGPDIASYRGLKIINSRSFSMEEGAPPRDVLRRRVRVAEYYRIPYEEGVEDRSFAFYDESKDAWQKFTWQELERMAMVGEMREMDSSSADWDDEEEYYEKRVTKLPNYGCKDPVDVYLSDELFKHMTVGEIEGDWRRGFALEGTTGNLVLNPWYALHRFNVFNGTGRAGLQVPATELGGFVPGNVDQMRIRQGYMGGATGPPAVPHNFPAPGRRYYDRNNMGDHRFSVFDEYLRAFGYSGRKVTWKTDSAIQRIRAQHAAYSLNPSEDVAEQYANGTTPVPPADEGQYIADLQNVICNESMRGHPDYEHYSYKVARHNFHRFFIMYLSGKADHLPQKAREFFDNFNWQRFSGTFGAGRLGTEVFADLLARLYLVERSAFSNATPPTPGIVLRGNTFADRSTAINTRLEDTQKDRVELVIIRPNIEHNMLGIIMVSLFPCPLFAQALFSRI